MNAAEVSKHGKLYGGLGLTPASAAARCGSARIEGGLVIMPDANVRFSSCLCSTH